MEKFNIDYQFDEYLKRVYLNKEQMSQHQLKEITQAFVAGVCCMMLMQADIATLPTESRIPILKNLLQQCSAYWKAAIIEHVQSEDN